MSGVQFRDRFDGGRVLAAQLAHYSNAVDVLVLALPRGGVPVAFEIATRLNIPMDIFLVRKLGVPGYEELAMGAIASGGAFVLNEEIVQHLGISEQIINMAVSEQQRELERREELYRGSRPPPELKDRRTILVDDGLATGASMRAAIRALRQSRPASITVAVPVASASTCEQLKHEVDEMICARTPEPFEAVGQWYSDFQQLTDEEVTGLLNRAAHEQRVRRVTDQKAVEREVFHTAD
jgi:putative phosphoribosyl transferase